VATSAAAARSTSQCRNAEVAEGTTSCCATLKTGNKPDCSEFLNQSCMLIIATGSLESGHDC